jgi:hypothetical protein
MKYYIILVLILFVLIGGIVWIFIQDTPPTIEKPQYTVGAISSLKQGQRSSGLDALITYFVDGENYESRIVSTANSVNVVGEKFTVVYEEENPRKSIVISLPVFSNNELEFVKETKGVITVGVHKYNFTENEFVMTHAIEFEYIINGKKYTKSQSLPKDYKKKYPSLKEGDKYCVKYWIKNFERVIINLDEPVK